jgi:hypothetical protein
MKNTKEEKKMANQKKVEEVVFNQNLHSISFGRYIIPPFCKVIFYSDGRIEFCPVNL